MITGNYIIKTAAIAAVLVFAFTACKTKEANTNVSYTGEQTIIYKTRNNYSKNVPVTMNAAKSEIVAYPSPKDVYYNGKLATPTALANDFWLDNRGIGTNTAFLKLTYEEYAKLGQAPPMTEMLTMIVDNDPIIEMYNLGTRSRFKDEVTEINELIEKKDAFKKFKKLK
jgi:hypothetical protein